jgi:hypothetical protein
MNQRTVLYGDDQVRVMERSWVSPSRLPYRKTYGLKPGQHWKEAPVTPEQWEHYVLRDGEPVPVGAVIASELLAEGASVAVFTELWGGVVLVGADLVCVAEEGEIRELLDSLRVATGSRLLGGLPDVIGIFPDGRVAMRAAKNIGAKDRVGPKQHAFARAAQRLLGNRLDLAVVEWGRQPSTAPVDAA